MKRFLILCTLALGLSTLSFAANTTSTYVAYPVGSTSCDIAIPGYQTIQAAVNAVPSGSTIKVCPGTYPEQVTISKPLTLTGFIGNAEALVTIPSGGLTCTNDPLVGDICAQILVQASPIDITDLAFDGTGNGISPGCCDLTAIFYEESSGTVNGISVENEIDDGGGSGVLVASDSGQTVTVENSDFRNYDGEGVWASTPGQGQATRVTSFIPLTMNVKSNTFTSTNTYGYQNSYIGISISGPVQGTVSNNLVNGSGNGYGIELDGSTMTMTGNTVVSSTTYGPPNAGLLIIGGGNIVKSNRLDSGSIGVGIILSGSAAGGVVQQNTVTGGYGGYGIDMCNPMGSAIGFNVTGNTIVDTPGFGLRVPASGDVTAPNTYFVDGPTPVVVGC